MDKVYLLFGEDEFGRKVIGVFKTWCLAEKAREQVRDSPLSELDHLYIEEMVLHE